MALKFYAADWRKTRRKRFKPTGMGKLLDRHDGQFREYIKNGREMFIKKVSGPESAKSDDERYLQAFKKYNNDINAIYNTRSGDWTDRERRFIKSMLGDYAEEIRYWEKKPCTKLYLFEKDLAVKIVGEKEKVLEAIRDMETHAKDQSKRLKVKVTIKSA